MFTQRFLYGDRRVLVATCTNQEDVAAYIIDFTSLLRNGVLNDSLHTATCCSCNVFMAKSYNRLGSELNKSINSW